MVIRGRTRGNGRQLADYLLEMKDNEDIRILDVVGRDNANADLLKRTLLSMSLTSELTKSDKGLYHAQINPAYGEDKMQPETWLEAADMLAKELGFEEQRRLIVLHTKKGRTHAHVVWERYDQEKGIMISDSFSRLAQDRARLEMERVFEQKQTPKRNEKRPDMKQVLSGLWQKVKTGAEFIKAAKEKGFILAAGVQRRPFMVVDDTGRSFDLVRQLDGVKTKEVRERLKDQKLVKEKDVIELIRKRQKLAEKTDLEKAEEKPKSDRSKTAEEFSSNAKDISQNDNKTFEQKKNDAAEAFAVTKDEVLAKLPRVQGNMEKIASGFADNRNELLDNEKERKRQEVLDKLRQMQQNQNKKDKGIEPVS